MGIAESGSQIFDRLIHLINDHSINAWFPRSLDLEYGGFYSDFDRRWQLNGTQDKLIEFQARQTLFAAEALLVFPENKALREALDHGFCYLKNTMWDKKFGGWYHRLDRKGFLLESGTKHAHGAAYAILACVAVFEATGSNEALEHAKQGFNWLEQSAFDSCFGGYFGFQNKDGTPILETANSPLDSACDTVGTRIGLKDINVHSDLLETFTRLYLAWPDPLLERRLLDLIDLMINKMLIFSGPLPFFYMRDWTPYPHVINFGYQLQTVFRLIQARKHFSNEEKLKQIVKQLIEHTLVYGHDNRRGGFYYAGPGCAPCEIQGHKMVVEKKVWWIQVEALKAFLALSELCPENMTYYNHFNAQLEYFLANFIDRKWKGSYLSISSSKYLPLVKLKSRFLNYQPHQKGNVWKDSSHDGRTWLYCLSIIKKRQFPS